MKFTEKSVKLTENIGLFATLKTKICERISRGEKKTEQHYDGEGRKILKKVRQYSILYFVFCIRYSFLKIIDCIRENTNIFSI